MKKIAFLILIASVLLSACKKKVDELDFADTVIGGTECTGAGTSISELDWGWIVELDKPAGIGNDYTDKEGITHHNVVLLYGTHTRLSGDVKGKLYLDKDYASSYCFYRPQLGIPHAVCSRLD
ncbi:MAG: hypothetical protein IJ620_01370 [Bacteroidales bacterium]|nr:hypothetical protein [Bacteroidales bacterium]